MAKAAPKKAAPMKAAPKKAAAQKAPAAKRSMALCAQLYTVRDHLAKPEQVLPTLKKVAKIGYKYVQLSGGCLDAVCPLELKGWLDAAGVVAVGHHSNYETLNGKFGEMVDRLHTLGVQYTAIAWCGVEYRKDAATWKKSAAKFDALAKRYKAEGITLQYHNHHFEFERFGDKVGLEILFENTCPKCLQAEIDTAWVARGLQSPAEWVAMMKGRMDQVHFKDTKIVRENTAYEFAEIGSGNLDWAAIVAACKKIGVQDVIIEQDAHWIGGNPFKALEVSYKFLNKKFGLK